MRALLALLALAAPAGLTTLGGCHAPLRATPAPETKTPVVAAPVAAARAEPAAEAPLTPAQIAERATPSVALIKMKGSLGSGFIVSEDGKIATNLHVIRGASEAIVTLADGREFKDVEVLGVDEVHDLALLRVPMSGLPALILGDSGAVTPGEHVVAIGNPLGFGNTISDGLVSAIRKVDTDLTVLQISAPISPGSSGGPLLDERGHVIGVSFLMSTRGQNLNFGVPIAYLKPLLLSETAIPLADFARRRRALGGLGQTRRREIPIHETSELKGCRETMLQLAVTTIAGAISVGAPLYNDGNHEACYRIYEGAALELEHKVRSCSAVKRAMSEGRKRAGKLEDWDDKAWAMRDAFDGLVDVIQRHLEK